MVQEMVDKIPKVEWLFRQTVLNAKVAKIGGNKYCIHHLYGLKDIKTNKPIEDKGVVEFQAKAEVHFVPLDEGGISFSNGEYLILGSLEWKDDNWTIVDQLVIKDWVNTLNLQKWEKDEQGDI